jgi:SAM-dependent methyltransferase
VNQGADVVALDISPKMVQFAKERLGEQAEVLQANLDQPLDFLENGSFDIVLSALALDYVQDVGNTFREFHRVLRQSGLFVFSVGHPFGEFILHPEGSYFETELVDCEWTGFDTPITMPSYRRPLGALLNPLIDAGFVLERILEPTPTERFREEEPEDYAKLHWRPGFLCIRAAKKRKP